MKKQLKQVIYGILEQTSYSQDELLKKGGKKRRTNVMKATVKPSLDEEETLADKALRGLYDEIPGLEGIMRHFHQQKEEETDQETLADFDDEVTAEEDYVNQMLAPSMSFQEEMKHHGGDFDGDGHISQHEVDMYRQVQLLSMTNDKVDMLDQHLTNHMFGEYEIMTRLTSRQHSVECQGVVIAFYIAPDHMLRICADYPELEEELWKRAAVTAAKLRLVEPPHDYRHRLTRDLRIAFQNGRVSSPITRKSKKYSEKWGLEFPNEGEVVHLATEDDHVFILRTHYHDENDHMYSTNTRYNVDAENVTDGRDSPLLSGPGEVHIKPHEVAIVYTLVLDELKRGVGSPGISKFRSVAKTVQAVVKTQKIVKSMLSFKEQQEKAEKKSEEVESSQKSEKSADKIADPTEVEIS